VWKYFTLLSLVSFAIQPVLAQCTKASLKGSYGYAVSSINILTVAPSAAVGRFDSQGNGKGTGFDTLNVNDNLKPPRTTKLTYQINPDCTGMMTISSSIADGLPPLSLSFVLTNRAQDLLFVQTNALTTGYGSGKKLGANLVAGCSTANFLGSYGYLSSLVGSDSAAVTGVINLDGQGAGTGRDTTNFGGTVITRDTTATYSVRSNCTGQLLLFNSIVQQNIPIDFVVVGDGTSFLLIQSDNGVGAGNGQKI